MIAAMPPFLTIPENLVECSGWVVRLSTGDEHENPVFIENWDNGTDLSLTRRLCLDVSKVHDALQIQRGGCRLELIIWAGTGVGRLPEEKWIAARIPIVAESTETLVDFNVRGESLADALHLDSAIVVQEISTNAASLLSPTDDSSIVWRERVRIRLEGDVPRFPVSEVDLVALLGDESREALWHLHVDWRDFSADFGASVRLHINSRQREFVQSFRAGDPCTLQMVMTDVMTQIITGFLAAQHDQPFQFEGEETGTLAGVAVRWIDLAFGSIDAASRIREVDTGLFHGKLNALAAIRESA